jgi:hypothetical protein
VEQSALDTAPCFPDRLSVEVCIFLSGVDRGERLDLFLLAGRP